MACSVGGASSAEEERDRFEERRKRMSISLDALYIIPLIMILISIVLLFQPVKTKNVDDKGMIIAMFMGVCVAAVLLGLAIFAFDMICKVL